MTIEGNASTAAASETWVFRGHTVDLSERTFLLGILNVTPDSFSDGGSYETVESAIAGGERLAEEGADGIDIGGESTRPGRAETVTAAEEIKRVIPVVRELRRRLPAKIALSVDTYRAEVAEQALDAGADIINDIYGLTRSPEIADLVAKHGAGLILMHMQGEPENMQEAPRYKNVLVDIRDFLRRQMDVAKNRGVSETALVIDPGIGFGKTVEHNVRVLSGLEYLRLLQRPIAIGVSRKGFLGKIAAGSDAEPLPVTDRGEATIGAEAAAVLQGARLIRTHDVRASRRALAIIDALRRLL